MNTYEIVVTTTDGQVFVEDANFLHDAADMVGDWLEEPSLQSFIVLNRMTGKPVTDFVSHLPEAFASLAQEFQA